MPKIEEKEIRNMMIFKMLESGKKSQHELAREYGISRKRIADIYYRELKRLGIAPKRLRNLSTEKK